MEESAEVINVGFGTRFDGAGAGVDDATAVVTAVVTLVVGALVVEGAIDVGELVVGSIIVVDAETGALTIVVGAVTVDVLPSGVNLKDFTINSFVCPSDGARPLIIQKLMWSCSPPGTKLLVPV